MSAQARTSGSGGSTPAHGLPASSKLETSRSATLGGDAPHVRVEFCQYAAHMSTYVDYRVCPEVSSAAGQKDLCRQFSVSVSPLL